MSFIRCFSIIHCCRHRRRRRFGERLIAYIFIWIVLFRGFYSFSFHGMWLRRHDSLVFWCRDFVRELTLIIRTTTTTTRKKNQKVKEKGNRKSMHTRNATM